MCKKSIFRLAENMADKKVYSDLLELCLFTYV